MKHRRALIAALPALVLGLSLARAPAHASEAEPKKPAEAFVDLKPVGMPIVSGGRLLSYVFVTVRLNLDPKADVQAWRAKEPMFRDALVRAGYRTPFVLPNNDQQVDSARLSATLLRDASAIAGPGIVRSVTIVKQAPTRQGRPLG